MKLIALAWFSSVARGCSEISVRSRSVCKSTNDERCRMDVELYGAVRPYLNKTKRHNVFKLT